MPVKKISILKLEQLLKQGLNVSQIAEALNVTKGAVSKQIKKLDVAMAQEAAKSQAVIEAPT